MLSEGFCPQQIKNHGITGLLGSLHNQEVARLHGEFDLHIKEDEKKSLPQHLSIKAFPCSIFPPRLGLKN